MKKMVFKNCFLISILSFLGFAFSSCSHIFDSEAKEIKYSGLCTVYGKIDDGVSGAFPSARTAFPEIDSSDVVYFNIVAKEALEAGSPSVPRTYSSHYVSTESSFEIGLPIGIWKLYAYGYKNYSADEKKYSNLMLASQYGSEISITDITNPMVLENPVSVHFATDSEIQNIEGSSSSTGGISLEIDTSGTEIKKVSLSCDYSEALSKTYDCSGGSLTIEEDSIGTGEYRVGFYFYASTEENAVPVYYFSELIYIYPNATTNTWKSDAEYISGGKITVTKALVERFKKTVFYVSGDEGNDANSGSFLSPLKTIERAVEIIDANGNETTEYKIYLLSDLTATSAVSSGTFVDISSSSPRKMKISSYKRSPDETFLIDANQQARALNIGSNAEVTLERIQVTGGKASAAGGGIEVFGKLHLKSGAWVWGNEAEIGGGGIDCYGEVYLYDGCVIYQNTAPLGGGIYIGPEKKAAMYGGKILSNIATSDGAGVYIFAGATFDVQGGSFSGNGCAVYSSGNLKLSGNIDIADDDYIFVDNLKTIELTDGFTSAGSIPVDFGNYTTTEPVLTGVSEVVSANYQKFVLKNSSYKLKSDGTLQKATEPKIGDILLADGTFVPASQYSAASGEAVGILFYKKSILAASTEEAYFNENQSSFADSGINSAIAEIDSLVIGLEYATAKNWDSSAYSYNEFNDLKGTTTSGTISCISGWEIVKSVAEDKAGDPGANFPAYDYILNYRKGESNFNSDWYMPAACELAIVYRNLETLNASLEKAGKTKLTATHYWTCTNVVSGDFVQIYSIALNFADGTAAGASRAGEDYNVLPVLALDSEGKVVKTARVCEMSDCYTDSSEVQNVPGAGYTCYVSSEDDLKYLRTLVNSGKSLEKVTIKLKNDITLTDQWTPIGTDEYDFSGNFDGQNHKISGLNVNADYQYAGFFGIVSATSSSGNISIKNLTVEGLVEGTSAVGGIAGYIAGSSDCIARINGCVSAVKVTATGFGIGGICGAIGNYATVQNCVNISEISGSGSVGGITGSITGFGGYESSIINCVNFGSVSGTDISSGKIGGLAGADNGNSAIKNSYNAGSVTGNAGGYGSVCGSSPSGTYNTVYWISGTADSAFASGSHAEVSDIDSNYSELLSDFFNQYIIYSLADGTFSTYKKWLYTFNLDGKTYPVFIDVSEYEITGTGSFPMDSVPSAGDTLVVTEEGHLRKIASWVNDDDETLEGVNFVLGNPIVLTENWTPIGGSSKPFYGNIDGNGYEISNLVIESSTSHCGFIGFYETGTIKNLTLKGKIINSAGKQFLGGLIGDAEANYTIDNCVVDVEIETNCTQVGGIVGYSESGLIKNSLHRGNITLSYTTLKSTAYCGGVVGYIYSTAEVDIFNCGHVGSIGNENYACYVGGVAGGIVSNRVTVKNCFSNGNVLAKSSFGGISGANKGEFTYCYYSSGSDATYAISSTPDGDTIKTFSISDGALNSDVTVNGYSHVVVVSALNEWVNMDPDSYKFWTAEKVGLTN